ncbi:class I SAM-dependent methyltransferase [Nitrospirillum amazonense]|uniref:Methyltransferase family protein n=1 Tax=Nitrospirillum amazonense TaxID=28077 RepID=A0A560KA12_9PROT|nr:class I SAM-dependent methyltransferase [Nitrospirillum amazonense]MDG3441355.1 hypothetical protein [Nitrospirillum amazonense]TWB80155.1 hypothetical protein FBZ87_102579 [Nitrospirillum amazonense]
MYHHNHAGVDFRVFIQKMVKSKMARTYMEIGVRDGSTLAMIDCSAIGVDPDFQFSSSPVGTKPSLFLYQKTSDQFFRDHDARAISGDTLDVVFLDGLHQFEYLLRDFINSEKSCNRHSLIMLDDCLPVNAEMTERRHNAPQRKNQDYAGWWTGDVWKMIPILKKYRKDLHITLVDTTPTGIVCITNLNPSSTILEDNYYEILKEFDDAVMTDENIEKFYQENEIDSSQAIMAGFNASLTVGP